MEELVNSVSSLPDPNSGIDVVRQPPDDVFDHKTGTGHLGKQDIDDGSNTNGDADPDPKPERPPDMSGGHWEWQPGKGWWFVNDPPEDRESLYDNPGAGVAEPPNPGMPDNWLGEQLAELGYQYLGPGTNLLWNLEHDVPPINFVDAVARNHDIDYKNIGDRFRNGDIDWVQAQRELSQADRAFISRAQRTAQVDSLAAACGMTVSWVANQLLGYNPWGGITQDEYNTNPKPPPVGKPGWDMPPDSDYYPPGWEDQWRGRNSDTMSASVVPFDNDRDRNYFPDRLERSHKRKRHGGFGRNARSGGRSRRGGYISASYA